MTKKKHEELVEEIAGRIRHYKHFAEKRFPTASERIKASFDLAELFVTDVLSAVHDGGLDEELGVVGRAKKDPSNPATWTVTVAALESLGATELIALRGQTKRGEGETR